MLTRLTEFWRGLSPLQKIVVGGVPLLLIAGAAAAIVLVISAPPVKAPLFRNLELADAARIVEVLKKQDVDYELENDGCDILVPPDKVYDLRLSLASAGLPQRSVGFELFDKAKLGITETGLKVDYQRALQGELARTLESMQQVDKATVLLNIAPETSFLDSDTHSTASVALQLKQGQTLGRSQVQGIQHLVSHAVSRLAAQDVSIMDGSGNPLTGDEQGESATMLAGLAATDLQQKFRSRVERDLEDKIRKVLEGPYGTGKVSPSVTVEVDFRAVHNESETYTPVSDGQGIEKHVEEHRDKTVGAGEDVGGVPGTTSNVPGYLGISDNSQQATESSKYDLIVDYLVNKQVTLEDLPPGVVTRRSAAVALSTDTWDAAAKQSVEALVASAIGADVQQGDNVMVQAFQFSEADSTAVTQAFVAQQRNRTVSRIAGWALALLMVGGMMLLLRSIVRGGLPQESLALAGAAAGGKPGAYELPEEEEFALRRLDEVGATQQDRMRSEIDRMLDKNPNQVLALLRSWMLED